MKPFRTLLFWTHLAIGVVAGVVILIMSVTGVALTYEKQMLEWADQRAHPLVPPSDGARALPPETLLAAVLVAHPGAAPTGVMRRSDPFAPTSVSLEGNRTVLVNPYTGVVVGEPSTALRGFFRTMTSWHRWLALEGASRSTGKLITGVANLGFLFIVLSGLYLWVPRIWTWVQFKQVLWFRGGLPGKARDFNWHNVIGVWTAVPLAIVVAGAVPISFGWAGALVYRLAGEVPPAAQARPGGLGGQPGPGRGGGPSGRGEGGRHNARGGEPRTAVLTGLDAAWARAEAQVPEWRAINLRLAGPADAPFAFTIDSGYGGQPQKRGTLTVDRASATVTKWETFADQSPGRRLRSWLRFAHTGEYYGLVGQTVAGLVSAGGAVLVYTGIALAWRRFWSWTRRRAVGRVTQKAA